MMWRDGLAYGFAPISILIGATFFSSQFPMMAMGS
jgi:hypothetical protein